MRNANSAGKSARGRPLRARGGPPAPPARLSPLRLVYGICTWLQFLLAAALVLPVLLLTPQLSRRRALVGRIARLALRLAGMRLEVHRLRQLPEPRIVGADHSSYLAGVVLGATSP